MNVKGYRCDKCGKYLPRVWWSHIVFRGFSDDCHLCKDCTRRMNEWICHKDDVWDANISEREDRVLIPSSDISIEEKSNKDYSVSDGSGEIRLSDEMMISVYCYVRDGQGRFVKEKRT